MRFVLNAHHLYILDLYHLYLRYHVYQSREV